MCPPPIEHSECPVPVRGTGGGAFNVGERDWRSFPSGFPVGPRPDGSPHSIWRPSLASRIDFELYDMRVEGGTFIPWVAGSALLCLIALPFLLRKGGTCRRLAWSMSLGLVPLGIGLLGSRHGLSLVEGLLESDLFCLDRGFIVRIGISDALRPFHAGAFCSAAVLLIGVSLGLLRVRSAHMRDWLHLAVPLQLASRMAAETYSLDARCEDVRALADRPWIALDGPAAPLLPVLRKLGSTDRGVIEDGSPPPLPDRPLISISADGVASYDDTHGREPAIPLPPLVGRDTANASSSDGVAFEGETPVDFVLAVDRRARWDRVSVVIKDLMDNGYVGLVFVVRDPDGRLAWIPTPTFGLSRWRDPEHMRDAMVIELDASGVTLGGWGGVLGEACDGIGAAPTVQRRSGVLREARIRECALVLLEGTGMREGWLSIEGEVPFGEAILVIEALEEPFRQGGLTFVGAGTIEPVLASRENLRRTTAERPLVKAPRGCGYRRWSHYPRPHPDIPGPLR
jgi:hypothetical protein